MTGVGPLTRSVSLRRRDFRGAELCGRARGSGGRARGDKKCKTPPRSDIYRGGVLCSVRERTTRELLRPTNRANWQSRVQVQRSARPRKKTAQSHLRAWAYLCPRRITPSRSLMQRHRQSQFVRHAPSRSLSGRMSVGVKSDPTELAATQTAAWPWGSRRSGLLFELCARPTIGSECDFLDNRWLWPRKAGAAICALMSTRPIDRRAMALAAE